MPESKKLDTDSLLANCDKQGLKRLLEAQVWLTTPSQLILRCTCVVILGATNTVAAYVFAEFAKPKLRIAASDVVAKQHFQLRRDGRAHQVRAFSFLAPVDQ